MRQIKFFYILWVSLVMATPLAAKTVGNESNPTQLPVLSLPTNERIDLSFSEPTSVRHIYQVLSRAWGVNFVFDPRLKDQELVISLKRVTPSECLENILRAAGHFQTVVDRQTLLIADDTPQNRRTYEHQVIQSFYLENTRVADMMTLLRSIIGAKHIAVMDGINGIVLRDTAEKVRVAEQIVRRNDRAAAEVVVDVDLLAVDRQTLLELDLHPAIGVAGGEPPPRLAAGEIDRLRDQAALVLARPRLDIVAGATAKLQLTDKLPIPVQTATRSGTGTAGVSYQEVGLNIKIRPRVHNAEEVSLTVQITADTLTEWVTQSNGAQQPTFGGVSLESSIRLQDAETYLVTGLMIAPETAGALQHPIAGRFHRAVENGREIVLALTPHVVRGPGTLESDLEPFWIGTEAHITTDGSTRRAASPRRSPFEHKVETGTDD